MPQSARLSEGGEVRSLFGQCPNRPCNFFSGASLTFLSTSAAFFWLSFVVEYFLFVVWPQGELPWLALIMQKLFEIFSVSMSLICIITISQHSKDPCPLWHIIEVKKTHGSRAFFSHFLFTPPVKPVELKISLFLVTPILAFYLQRCINVDNILIQPSNHCTLHFKAIAQPNNLA